MSACNRCFGNGSTMSQRMVYASQGSYQSLVYDPCPGCGGSGRVKDRDHNQFSKPMRFSDSAAAFITLITSLLICWYISETAIYSKLSMNGQFMCMAASFIFSLFGAAIIFTLPLVQKLMSFVFGLVVLSIGFVILISLV